MGLPDIEPVDATNIFREIRMVKSNAEIALLAELQQLRRKSVRPRRLGERSGQYLGSLGFLRKRQLAQLARAQDRPPRGGPREAELSTERLEGPEVGDHFATLPLPRADDVPLHRELEELHGVPADGEGDGLGGGEIADLPGVQLEREEVNILRGLLKALMKK